MLMTSERVTDIVTRLKEKARSLGMNTDDVATDKIVYVVSDLNTTPPPIPIRLRSSEETRKDIALMRQAEKDTQYSTATSMRIENVLEADKIIPVKSDHSRQEFGLYGNWQDHSGVAREDRCSNSKTKSFSAIRTSTCQNIVEYFIRS